MATVPTSDTDGMTTAGVTQDDRGACSKQKPNAFLARDVRTAPVVAVSPGDNIRALLEAMHRTGVRHLVVEDGRCAGIVDDRRVVLEWAVSIGGAQRTARISCRAESGSSAPKHP